MSKTWYIKGTSWSGNSDRTPQRNILQDREMPYRFHRDVMTSPDGRPRWDIFYVVHVTHPDRPNYDGTSRGRKTHYAQSNKLKSKSLCNMLVSSVEQEHIDIRTDNSFSGGQANCQVCIDRANKIIREGA